MALGHLPDNRALAETEFATMWFVVALLACSLGYAALRSIRPLTSPRPRPDGRLLVVAASVIGLGSLAVWQFTTLLDTHLLPVRVRAWTQADIHKRWHHQLPVLWLGTIIDMNGRWHLRSRGDCPP